MPQISPLHSAASHDEPWQTHLFRALFAVALIALVVGGAAGFLGLLGELLTNKVNLAGSWFRQTFSGLYLLGLTVSLLVVGDPQRSPPRKRIVLAGLLSVGGFTTAWLAGASPWLLAALLPPWPLFMLAYVTNPDEAHVPPAPGRAPWQGE